MSTFAATTCSSVRSDGPAALRENFVRRGSTAWIVALPSSRGRPRPSRRRRELARAGLADEAAGEVAPELAELGEHDPHAAVLHGDAAGDGGRIEL